MIEIEVILSPDTDLLGPQIFYKNKIIFGKRQGDLHFDDPLLIDNHLRLEVFEKGVYCFKNDNVENFKINDKVFNTPQKISLNDTILIGGTKIILRNFLFTPQEDRNKLFKTSLDLILNSDKFSDTKEILKILENDLKDIQ